MTPAPEPPLRLAEATSDEAGAARAALLLLPVGSTEAHGPHLPLGTDVFIAEAIALRAAAALRRSDRPAFVLPPIPYSVCRFAASFAGTIGVAAETVARLIDEVFEATRPAPALVLVNGHLEPAHCRMLRETARRLDGREGRRVLFPDYRRPPTLERLGEEFRRGGGHGGAYETSLVLAARPDLVREDVARRLPPLDVDIAARLRAGASRAEEIGGERGYFGRPAEADRRHGERLLDLLAEFVADEVRLGTQEDEGAAGGGEAGGAPSFETELRVRFGEVDRAGIAYYPVVQHYCHVVFEEFFERALGLPYREVIEGMGLGFPTVHTETDFEAPFRFGALVRATLTVGRVGRTSVRWNYRFHDAADGRLLATSSNTTVCVDMETFRPRPLPAELRAMLEDRR